MDQLKYIESMQTEVISHASSTFWSSVSLEVEASLKSCSMGAYVSGGQSHKIWISSAFQHIWDADFCGKKTRLGIFLK